eukprot:495935-Amphidinium_carterae.1
MQETHTHTQTCTKTESAQDAPECCQKDVAAERPRIASREIQSLLVLSILEVRPAGAPRGSARHAIHG